MASPRARPVRYIDRDLQAIGALTQAVLDGDDLEQLLGRIAAEARSLVGAVSGVVVTVAGDPGIMTFRAVDGLSVGPLRVGHVMPVRDTLTELALERASNIVARGASEIPPAGRAFAAATGTGPLIAAPLAVIGAARGVLVVARSNESPPFRTGDINLVSTFAAQAASAIELFDLRSAETILAVRAERLRIGRDLHENIVKALRDLERGIRVLAIETTDRHVAGRIEAAVQQLNEAITSVGTYVTELEAPPSVDPQRVHPARGRRRSVRPADSPTRAAASDAGRPDTIAVIGQLALASASAASADEILQSLVDEVVSRADARSALIGTLTDDGDGLLIKTRAGPDVRGRQVGDTVPIPELAARDALLTGRPAVWESLAETPGLVPESVKRSIGPLVAVPLAVRGRSFGILAIGRPVGAKAFSESHVRLIEAYGVQAAIALEFERVRRELRFGSISSERERIGRDLYERVIQLLFGVAFALQALEATVSDPATRARLQATVEGLDRTTRDLRRFVVGLGPSTGPDPLFDERIVALAADNARLQAEVEAQLDEVRASRTRIIAAGDAERKRVERDLHDGAQQRLVSLSLAIRLAQTKLGDDLDPSAKLSLDQASSDAKAALAELRELARGIHPQILTEAGLGAAVESLVRHSPVDVSVQMGAERYPSAIEGAAYFTISEALANVAKYAKATRAMVRADWRGDQLLIEIADDGIGGADPTMGSGLRGLADRLAAVNGTLEVTSPDAGGTRIVARIPTAVPVPLA